MLMVVRSEGGHGHVRFRISGGLHASRAALRVESTYQMGTDHGWERGDEDGGSHTTQNDQLSGQMNSGGRGMTL